MPFCIYCGKENKAEAKFCSSCGKAVTGKADSGNGNPKRSTVYEGELHKCPNCGELLDSFTAECPSCGYELRGAKSSGAVSEFAAKLEMIEQSRESEKFSGYIISIISRTHINKTDQRKINLIKNFPVPNTKEDILEFMLLAASNTDPSVYSSFNRVPEGRKAVNEAWNAKIEQVYTKAEIICSSDDAEFSKIKELYKLCRSKVKKHKLSKVLKWVLLLSAAPVMFLVIFLIIFIFSPSASEAAETEQKRLEQIEQTAVAALENKEYKSALLYAEELIYKPEVRNHDSENIERQWDIKRELLIDDIIQKAEQDGIKLEYTPPTEEEEHDNASTAYNGMSKGFEDGVKPGLDAAEKNIEKFKEIINGAD